MRPAAFLAASVAYAHLGQGAMAVAALIVAIVLGLVEAGRK